MDAVLEISKGDWGLPSIDLACLEAICYIKLSGAPVSIREVCAITQTLPILRVGGQKKLSTFQDIASYLRQKNYSVDYHLSAKQCAEVRAYECLLQEKLYPALEYIWWLDHANYHELTRPTYAKLYPVPLNWYLIRKQRSQAENMCHVLFPTLDEPRAVETAIYKQAQECLTILANKLGEREYFGGSSPCSLDATVFAYLAPLLQAPLPNATLQEYLKACTNLRQFVTRIVQRFFSKELNDYEAERKKKAEVKTAADNDFPNKTRNMIFAGIFALLAMVGYAFGSGMIQVETEEYDDDEEEEE